jgi:hypothetical protein
MSLLKLLEVQSQDGQDGCKLGFLGGLPELAAPLKLIPQVEVLTAYELLEGLGDLGKGHVGCGGCGLL